METTNRFSQSELQSWGIALLRVVVGVVFLAHGAQKLFVYGIPGTAGFLGHAGIPFPMLSAVLTIGAEFLGGLFLLLGLFTRPAAAFLAIVPMLYARKAFNHIPLVNYLCGLSPLS